MRYVNRPVCLQKGARKCLSALAILPLPFLPPQERAAEQAADRPKRYRPRNFHVSITMRQAHAAAQAKAAIDGRALVR